ncbi:MAG: leucine-rich repeat domain-containing protein [Paramuribaculum sp.]|nr:leucine-rich repeat domain-containing protein [Paramuribaculum sp.]
MKKILISLFLIGFVFTASAKDFEYTYEGQTLGYTVVSDIERTCEVSTTTSISDGSSVIIPTTALDGNDEYNVVGIGLNAFLSGELVNLTIPNTITHIDIGGIVPRRCSIRKVIFQDGENVINITTELCLNADTIYLGRNLTNAIGGENLKSLTIGKYVTTLKTDGPDLKEIIVEHGEKDVVIDLNLYRSYSPIEKLHFNRNISCPLSKIASTLKEVYIGPNVTSLELLNFNKCDNLEKVEFSSIEQICGMKFELPGETGSNPLYFGKHLYIDGEEIVDLVIPNTVTEIGIWSFTNCVGLNTVTIPEGVTRIGQDAFFRCGGLKKVTMSNSVTTIEGGAFSDCSNLASVIIGNSVTTIGDGAFYGCSSLTEITIPESVTTIEGSAFSNSGLTEVTIPNTVTELGGNAFGFCENLKNVIIADGDTELQNSKTMLRESNVETLYLGRNLKNLNDSPLGSFNGLSLTSLNSLTVSARVDTLPEYAFEGCTGLKNVTIADGENPLKCGSGIFDWRASIETLYLGRNIINPEWGSGLFNSQSKLHDVNIGDMVSNIAPTTFRGCTSLTSIAIPSSVKTIGGDAFSNCGLTKIIIPATVDNIGSSAFANCANLTEMEIADCADVLELESGVFYDSPIDTLYIGRNLSDNYGFFYDTPHQKHLTIGSLVSSLGDGLHYQSELGTLIIKDGEIPLDLPSLWDSPIETLYLGRNLKGTGHFSHIEKLRRVTISSAVTAIPGSEFSGCENLTEISMPNSITSIGSSAFEETGLTSVIIPQAVHNIGHQAFDGCRSLASVSLPDSLIYIGEYAFSDCTALTSITIPNTVTTLSEGAFDGCSALTSVTIPNSVNIMRKNVFSDCI